MKKLLLVISLMCFALGASAQVFQPQSAILKVSGTGVDSVLVTNTGTSFIYARVSGPAQTTTIQFVAHKVAGTIAGTVTLMGSVDGVHFKACTVAEASTAIPTFTATDVATQSYIWRLNYCPYPYYGISWTGTGTMTAYFRGRVVTH
jgi:hypothetical protein